MFFLLLTEIFSILLWQVKISKEYPVRPPLFSLNLYYPTSGEVAPEDVASDWYNDLRAMEAEVRHRSLSYSINRNIILQLLI